ncbi:MAG TPA: hypothetical protein VJ861_03750 [Treponemataceae bacterium]|nr:hypothetical protein [Treponemataceae bacterium]
MPAIIGIRIIKSSLETNGVSIMVPGIPLGSTGRFVVVRYQGGESLLSEIIDQDDETVTLADTIESGSTITIYLMGLAVSASSNRFPLAVSGETVFSSECPGMCAGRELGWPVVLFLGNTAGNEQLEGGIIAHINV